MVGKFRPDMVRVYQGRICPRFSDARHAGPRETKALDRQPICRRRLAHVAREIYPESPVGTEEPHPFAGKRCWTSDPRGRWATKRSALSCFEEQHLDLVAARIPRKNPQRIFCTSRTFRQHSRK